VKTIYDFVTVGLFAGLVILFLQRSTAPEPQDHMYQYAPPAIGCALANWLGNQGVELNNQGFHVAAVATIVASIGWVIVVLKPFNQNPRA
jgi:hypothetical protein